MDARDLAAKKRNARAGARDGATRAMGEATLELGEAARRAKNDDAFEALRRDAEARAREDPLSDGDVIVVRRVRGARSAREAFGEAVLDETTAPRLTAVRITRGDEGGNGKEGAKYAFVVRDGNFDAGCYGKYVTVHKGETVMRFETKAVTREAQWALAGGTRRDGKITLRSCARKDVILEGRVERKCSALVAFRAWSAYERASEMEAQYQVDVELECETLLETLADGFAKELRAIEADIIDAGRAKLGPRVIPDEMPSPIVPVNPFARASPMAASPEPHVVELDPLPSLEKRSNDVNPSTPAGAIGSWRGKHVFNDMDDYPSPTDAEIAAVRDEAWRFTSTAKKSTAARGNPFEDTPASSKSTRVPQATPGMSDYWEFDNTVDESIYEDARTPSSFNAREDSTSSFEFDAKETRTTTTTTFVGKYNQFESDDMESAAIRKSGIDPRNVVSTPGTTSAMLKYVGQMYVSEFRSEMNILNVPYVTLDEVVVDFVEHAARKRGDPTFNDPRVQINEALSEQYIMSMKTDDFLLLLHDYGDEPGYAEVATLKRALAIAITTKGALSSSDSEI